METNDLKSKLEKTQKRDESVIEPIEKESIHGNMKKILLIGKTGVGKSSLCNVLTGQPHDADIFPVSAAPEGCTSRTRFAEAFFGGAKEREFR